MEKRELLSADEKMKSLNARVLDLERRVAALERYIFPSKRAQAAPSDKPKGPVEHKYLGRAISVARRDYERKYR